LALRKNLSAEPAVESFLETHVRVYNASELSAFLEGRDGNDGATATTVEPLFATSLHGTSLGLESLEDSLVYVAITSSINTKTYLHDPLVSWMRENYRERQIDGKSELYHKVLLLENTQKEGVVSALPKSSSDG
jgi:hypothetical protein